MWNKNISDLLDLIQDDSVALRETKGGTTQRVQELTLAKLHGEAKGRKIGGHRRAWFKGLAAAACLCLAAATVAAAARSGFHIQLLQAFTGRSGPGSDFRESGYDLGVEIEKISIEELAGEIQQVSEYIQAQYEEYEPWSSQYPGHWQKTFSSVGEARNFIGCTHLKELAWDLEEEKTTLSVYGNSLGQIQSLELETDYTAGDIRIQAFSRLFTQYYGDEVTVSGRTTEDVEYLQSVYTTAAQKQCYVLTQAESLESEYFSMEGYLVEDGILYSVNLAYLEPDAEQAQSLLHQWAEQF